MSTNIQSKIEELAAQIADDKGLFLVDVEIKHGKETTLWIYLDAEDRGVSLDEFAEISKELGFLIEAHEVFENRYRLNVSSPGLSRPLADKRQYSKNVGRKARVKYKRNNEYITIEGKLLTVEDDVITVKPNEKTIGINFNEIVETKILPSI